MAWPPAPNWRQALCWKEPATEAPGWDEMAETLVDPEVGLCSRSARFTAADVVEHLCALSGGRLRPKKSSPWPTASSLRSMAVRLTPDIEEGRRRPAEWSTAAHRALEDRTLALIDALAGRHGPAVNGAVRGGDPGGGAGAGRGPGGGGQGAGRGGRWPPGGARPGRLREDHDAPHRRPGGGPGRPPVSWPWPPRPRRWPSWPGPAWTASTIARLRLDLYNGPLAGGHRRRPGRDFSDPYP